MDDVRDDAGKKYELVNNIKDYQREVRYKTYANNEDAILAVVTELSDSMIAMTTTRWKEVADARDDAVVNG